MDQLRVNPTNTFWKMALGFFPFYSNLQKRISHEDSAAVGMILPKNEETNCSRHPLINQAYHESCFHEVVCKDDDDNIPEMEELSMGSGWSASSQEESNGGVATQSSATYPSDEITDDGTSSLLSTNLHKSSYSNSFYNFARTPSMNDIKQSK